MLRLNLELEEYQVYTANSSLSAMEKLSYNSDLILLDINMPKVSGIEHGFDMGFVMLIALDYGTISYRNIKENVNVRLIAEALGRKGHDKAAASPICEKQKQKLIDILTPSTK